MKITISYIEQKFKVFNQQIFAGQLPPIPIELSDAKSFLGVCVSKSRTLPNGEIEHYDFRLRINTRLDLPEQEVEDTIIHEMIHYYIGINNLKDTSVHGSIFKHLMNSINEKHGRHISISYKTDNDKKEELFDKRQRYHVVAIISFKNGKTGLKVLPRIVPQILYYYNQVGSNRTVIGIKLYMSKDSYFNRFPNSTALNVTYVDLTDVMKHLNDADDIGCDGKHLIINGKTYENKQSQDPSKKLQYRVIAVMSLTDGKIGVKVLPRTESTIIKYYVEMKKHNEVKDIKLFMSNSEYFDKYPKSGSLVYHEEEASIVEEKLQNADRLKYDGVKIIKI